MKPQTWWAGTKGFSEELKFQWELKKTGSWLREAVRESALGTGESSEAGQRCVWHTGQGTATGGDVVQDKVVRVRLEASSRILFLS